MNGDRHGNDKILPILGVMQHEGLLIEVDIRPFKRGGLAPPDAGEQQQADIVSHSAADVGASVTRMIVMAQYI